MSSGKRIVLALLAVLITVSALWWTNRTVTPRKSTMADVRAEASAGGYRLINTAQLAEKYRNPPGGMLLVDTRQDWEYRAGHIKGAINFAMEPTWWSRWHKKDDMALVLGPDKNRLLVFY
jgi:3-mercaptopyruvate sulfurtransferase SseA